MGSKTTKSSGVETGAGKAGKVRWKLKPRESGFQVTREGPFEYQTFKSGETYDRIPPEEADRFEPIGGGEEE